jgi:hypothetical protein
LLELSQCRFPRVPVPEGRHLDCQFTPRLTTYHQKVSSIAEPHQLQYAYRQMRSQPSWHSSSSHYHPYNRSSSYRQSQGAPSVYPSPVSAYGSYNAQAYGMTPDYSPYGTSGASSTSTWNRTGSYPAYPSYEVEEASAYMGQPASFLLPNTDPMSSSSNYIMQPYSSTRSNTQGWLDPAAQSTSQIMSSNYLNSADSAHYDPSLVGSTTNSKLDNAVPYQLITTPAIAVSNASDRTLPTPGSTAVRTHNASQSSVGSNLDALPLSATSHRSSIGWSTDSASSASHMSSHTSMTGGSSTTAQDFAGRRCDRVNIAESRGGEAQQVAYNYTGFNNTPQTSLPSSNLSGTGIEDVTGAYYGGKSLVLSTATERALSGLQALHEPQRCRTVSQDSQGSISALGSSKTATSSTNLHVGASSSLEGQTGVSNASDASHGGDMPDNVPSSAATPASLPMTAAASTARPSSSIGAGAGGSTVPIGGAHGYTTSASVTLRGGSGATTHSPQTRGTGMNASCVDGLQGLSQGSRLVSATYARVGVVGSAQGVGRPHSYGSRSQE